MMGGGKYVERIEATYVDRIENTIKVIEEEERADK
jgi:hypothetical protein